MKFRKKGVNGHSCFWLFAPPANQKIHEDVKNIDYQKIYSAFISHNSRLTPMTHKIGCQD
jgi:hypothetical protein